MKAASPLSMSFSMFGGLSIFGLCPMSSHFRASVPLKMSFRLMVLTFALLHILAGCAEGPVPHREQQLDSGWVLLQGDTAAPISAKVPGTVHTDLWAAGLITDPFSDRAESGLAWIEERDWSYRCVFDASKEQLRAAHTELHFAGLDTYARVLLNGETILEADNMFRSWTVPVTGLLRPAANVLEVHFSSPVQRHRGAMEAAGMRYPCDNDTSGTAPFVRKAAYHFGWDWAPRLVTSGIWRPVYLRSMEAAAIRSVWVEQVALSDTLAHLRAHVEVEVFQPGLSAKLEVHQSLWEGHLTKGVHTVPIDVTISDPRLWWPNGLGEAHLYPLELILFAEGAECDQHTTQVGLRNLSLVQASDPIGTSFYFEVNGAPVFAKGANYVPQDVFFPRVTDAQYRDLLIAARDAHMNMIRVWGGGVYERDLFYHLCDSLGIMVWHDFMFAGTTYPGDSLFSESAKAEATEQVRRLRNHPCMALWCGNNEIEVAWKHWGWQQKYGLSSDDSVAMWRDYTHIFEEVLPQVVRSQHPGLAYIPSTPQRNWGTPENFNHGAMHYWGVWHGREPLTAFAENVGRFMVEYGVQSYPDVRTLSPWISEGGLQLGSDALRSRQKSYIGDSEISRHIHDLGMAPLDFPSFVDASQEAQAQGLRMAIAAHRQSGGHCMGTLLWQLNDCWPGPSWSIIDYQGRKKKAYVAVQNAFAD